MQRMLVTATVIALVLVSLGIGAIAAHWPFWHRAWQWQTAAGGWPAQLAGPTFVLPPSASPWPLQLTVDKSRGLVISVEGQELRLEPLPKPEES